MHQFSKVELFSFTANESGEESEEMLKEMIAMQREIAEELGFHYRSVCTDYRYPLIPASKSF